MFYLWWPLTPRWCGWHWGAPESFLRKLLWKLGTEKQAGARGTQETEGAPTKFHKGTSATCTDISSPLQMRYFRTWMSEKGSVCGALFTAHLRWKGTDQAKHHSMLLKNGTCLGWALVEKQALPLPWKPSRKQVVHRRQWHWPLACVDLWMNIYTHTHTSYFLEKHIIRSHRV